MTSPPTLDRLTQGTVLRAGAGATDGYAAVMAAAVMAAAGWVLAQTAYPQGPRP